MTKINVLGIFAHPDDAELSCAGTLIAQQRMGRTTGVVDLTQGEMGTRGTVETRKAEAADASKIMNLSVRDNLALPDAFFDNTTENQLKVIRKIRQYQPDIVITNALADRHPDHGRAACLVEEAAFKAGLKKILTMDEAGNAQQHWRPSKVLHVIQSTSLEPHFFVDISDVHEVKMAAIRAYKTQFFNPDISGSETYISKPEFLEMVISRGREYGHRINVRYAEGFQFKYALGLKDLFHLA